MTPPQEKRAWRRYMYLWVNYALYEELETKARAPMRGGIGLTVTAQDLERARAVYKESLRIVPHKARQPLLLSYAFVLCVVRD
jgi:crooked neck